MNQIDPYDLKTSGENHKMWLPEVIYLDTRFDEDNWRERGNDK